MRNASKQCGAWVESFAFSLFLIVWSMAALWVAMISAVGIWTSMLRDLVCEMTAIPRTWRAFLVGGPILLVMGVFLTATAFALPAWLLIEWTHAVTQEYMAWYAEQQ